MQFKVCWMTEKQRSSAKSIETSNVQKQIKPDFYLKLILVQKQLKGLPFSTLNKNLKTLLLLLLYKFSLIFAE